MSGVAIALLFGLAAISAAMRGPRWAYAWVYLPILALTPYEVVLEIAGLPEVSGRLAGALGLLVGSALAKQRPRLLPAWRWFDALPVLAVLSYSISYAHTTDFGGFVNQLPVLTTDWLFPYWYARVFLRTREDLGVVLPPLGLSVGLMALLAVAEARLHMRLGYQFWHLLAGIPVPPWYIGEGARFGFLRAMATFTHPITLGVFFAAMTLVMLGWGHLAPRRRGMSAAAVSACLVGAAASLSRGPIVALAVGYLFYKAVARLRVRTVVVGTALVVVLVSPLLVDVVQDVVSAVQTDLETTGIVADNTHYRVALFVVYVQELGHVGWWGDPSVVGRKFEKAWSIDNAYLFLLVVGGWLGGGLFLAMTGYTLWNGTRSVAASSGRERALRAAGLGAFLVIAVSMLDIWFSPDYAAFFFVVSALVLNQSSPQWGAPAVRRREHPPAPPTPPEAPEEPEDVPLARALRGRPGHTLAQPRSARVRRPTGR